MDFRHHIRQSIDKSSQGLEVGPSFNPIAAKADGYRTHVVDHASQEDLRLKYAPHGADVARIEAVDLIDDGGPLLRLLPDGERYRWIIASHVIEHIPDLVGFLGRCQDALSDSGRLFLIVPDHRRCFDLLRPASTPGQVLQAHLEQRRTHSMAALFDHYLYAVTKNGVISWADVEPGEVKAMFTAADAWRIASPERASYEDCHGWTFTPSSCRLVFTVLANLGFTRLVEDEFHATTQTGTDFLIVLRKVPTAETAPLLHLMTQAARESVEFDHDAGHARDARPAVLPPVGAAVFDDGDGAARPQANDRPNLGLRLRRLFRRAR